MKPPRSLRSLHPKGAPGGFGRPGATAMPDAPTGRDRVQAVARLLRETLQPQLPAEAAFQARGAANARDLAAREWQLAPRAEAAARARLLALLGQDGEATAREAELCRRIADGRLQPQDPLLLEHLWAGTMDRMAIDQPNYAPYRDQIAATE